jgi:hypothetical protein
MMIMEANEKGDYSFDIEDMYQNYLARCSLTEGKMHPEQRVQVRQAFFGGISATLAIFKKPENDLTKTEVLQGLDKMWNDLSAYWNRRKKGLSS